MRHWQQRAIVLVLIGIAGLLPLSPAATATAEPVSEPGISSAVESATPPVDATATAPPYRLEEDRSVLRFTGKWTFANDPTSSGLSQRYSKAVYASVSMGFEGTGVSVIGKLGPNHGRARIYLDGVATRTVSFYAPSHRSQSEIARFTDLPPGRHTLKVVVLGSKDASSTDTKVHIDAFDIEGTPVSLGDMPGTRVHNGDKRLYRKGTWSTVNRGTAYRGTIARTSSRGAATTLRFKGTEVIWFGSKSAQGGKAEVWLDGKKVAVVSQYTSATAPADRRVIWAATGLRNTTHNVVIKALGQASAEGGGTRTDFDAFQVRGTVLTALRPTPFKYPWKNYIVIDKSDYKLYWVKNGVLVKTYPIAHGKYGSTPERVWRIDAKYRTSPGSVYGPRKMRMFKRVATSRGYRYVFTAYAIHGTNQEWVIGTQASAGCIRMYNKDVLELFPQVPTGTMVITRK